VIKKIENIIIPGSAERPISLDITHLTDHEKKPLVVFSHGFKGFKDWGPWDSLASYFAGKGLNFLKFNYSHNGVTPEDLLNFSDTEAFALNNFSIELNDLEKVIDWATSLTNTISFGIDPEQIFLLGHSRGGGISLIKAREDQRVKKTATWAAPCDFENKFTLEEIEHWKNEGVIYVENSRTNQMLPMYYQIVEDYFKNKNRVSISSAVKEANSPLLFVHGTNDDVVNLSEARLMKTWNPTSELFVIENADHTFNTAHPYTGDVFPIEFAKAVEKTLDFFRRKN
jgi:uncharacterized protein